MSVQRLVYVVTALALWACEGENTRNAGGTTGDTAVSVDSGDGARGDSDSGLDGTEEQSLIGRDTDSKQAVNWDPDNPNLTPGGSNNENRVDRLTCTYRTIEETETTFKGEIVVGNANTDYVWNGDSFTIWSVSFTTTSEITLARTSDFIYVDVTRPDNKTAVFDFGWQSVFEQGELMTLEVEGNKSGPYPYPTRCLPNYMRGDVIYPEYPRLPISFWPGKENLAAGDLIFNEAVYYQRDANPITENAFVYNPPHPSQIYIGLPEQMADHFNYNPDGDSLLVSGATGWRMFMPSKLLAMGIAFNYQWFKFNPNYFCALGSKENLTCLLLPPGIWSPSGAPTVNLDGVDYEWHTSAHPDGPFQQESGNFTDMASTFPDYFPPGASHDKYTKVIDPTNPDDPAWVTSVITSGISTVVSRETLWVALQDKYDALVFDAKDPWAELTALTFAYNRGIYALCPTGFFDDMDKLLSSDDVGTTFNLSGFGDHVPQIKGMVWNANQAVDHLYDVPLTRRDVDAFFDALRVIFSRARSDAQWSDMMADVHRAFDVLKVHWGDETVSFRYDFLTLLRVAGEHLPRPQNVRPTSQAWKSRATGPVCPGVV